MQWHDFQGIACKYTNSERERERKKYLEHATKPEMTERKERFTFKLNESI